MNFQEAVKEAIKTPNEKVHYNFSSNECGWVKMDTQSNKVVFFNTITECSWPVNKAKLYGTKTFLKRYGL